MRNGASERTKCMIRNAQCAQHAHQGARLIMRLVYIECAHQRVHLDVHTYGRASSPGLPPGRALLGACMYLGVCCHGRTALSTLSSGHTHLQSVRSSVHVPQYPALLGSCP